MARIGNYLSYQRRYERWQALRTEAGPVNPERSALAQGLLDDLPARLNRSEVTYVEARMLMNTLLEDLVPDAEQRALQLQKEEQRLSAAQPTPPAAIAQIERSRADKYKTMENAIVAQWQAMPVAQRDPQWLDSQLNAARAAAFEGQKNASAAP